MLQSARLQQEQSEKNIHQFINQYCKILFNISMVKPLKYEDTAAASYTVGFAMEVYNKP